MARDTDNSIKNANCGPMIRLYDEAPQNQIKFTLDFDDSTQSIETAYSCLVIRFIE